MSRLALLTLLASSLAFATKPTRPKEPCRTPADANARVTEAALEVARRVFPEAKVAQACSQEDGVWGVAFQQVKVAEGRVTIWQALGAFIEPQGSQWRLSISRDVLVDQARRIAQDPLVVRFSGREPLRCQTIGSQVVCVAEEQNNNVASPAPDVRSTAPPADVAPKKRAAPAERVSRMIPCPAFWFVTRPQNEKCPACSEFSLESFSVPSSKVSDATPGWCLLPREHLLRAATTAAKGACVLVSRSSSPGGYLSLLLRGPEQDLSANVLAFPRTADCAYCEPFPPCAK